MSIWFTSDTHFGAYRTLMLSKRPFNSVKEMDEVLVNNWNKVVKEEDEVYHLGDFGDYSFASRLNGKIHLIKGNYERRDFDQDKYGHLFESVSDNVKEVFIDGYYIRMGHEPRVIRPFIIDNNHINLFGHIHRLCMIKSYGLNVGTDAHFFQPISLETVLWYHSNILNFYDSDVLR